MYRSATRALDAAVDAVETGSRFLELFSGGESFGGGALTTAVRVWLLSTCLFGLYRLEESVTGVVGRPLGLWPNDRLAAGESRGVNLPDEGPPSEVLRDRTGIRDAKAEDGREWFPEILPL